MSILSRLSKLEAAAAETSPIEDRLFFITEEIVRPGDVLSTRPPMNGRPCPRDRIETSPSPGW